MKKFILLSALIIGPALKYAPNASTESNSVVTKQKKTTTTTSTTSEVQGTALGISIQSVPDTLGLSIGGAYYNDNTFTLTVGIGL